VDRLRQVGCSTDYRERIPRRSLSLLNSIIEGHKFHPVEFYLTIWDGITVRGVVVLVTVWLLAAVVGSAAFFYRSVGEATPGALGAIRMWTCAVHLLMTFLEDFSSVALLPVETRNPRGILEYFYRLPIGFERFVTSETSLRALQLLAELVLVLGLVGWRTRVVIPLAAFCHFLLLGILIDHSFFWHQNLVPLYLLFVLPYRSAAWVRGAPSGSLR